MTAKGECVGNIADLVCSSNFSFFPYDGSCVTKCQHGPIKPDLMEACLIGDIHLRV